MIYCFDHYNLIRSYRYIVWFELLNWLTSSLFLFKDYILNEYNKYLFRFISTYLMFPKKCYVHQEFSGYMQLKRKMFFQESRALQAYK